MGSATGIMATQNYSTTGHLGHNLVEHDGAKVTGYGGNNAKYPRGIWQGSSEPVGSRIDISWVGFEDTGYGSNNPPELWSQHGQDIQP